MAGGTPTASAAVGPGETVWRLIEYAWYQPDGNGKGHPGSRIHRPSVTRASITRNGANCRCGKESHSVRCPHVAGSLP
jgi:hypothetical protein